MMRSRIRSHRPFLLDASARILDELQVESSGEAAGDFALRVREVSAVGFEPIGPQVGAVFGVDQLHVDSDLVAGPPHAAFEDIADAELAPDLLHIDARALVGKGGVAAITKLSEIRDRSMVKSSVIPSAK